MQSQRTLPAPLFTSSARWPIANDGVQPMPRMPWSSRISGSCVLRNSSHVSHTCPSSCGMYWRGSSQIGHAAGGASLGGYCVPQALQTYVVNVRAALPDVSARSRSATHSTCGVCGNMSTGRARTRR